jgi:hypothetical protein
VSPPGFNGAVHVLRFLSLSLPQPKAVAAEVSENPCLYIGGEFEVVNATHIRNLAQLCFDKNDAIGILDSVPCIGDGRIGKVLDLMPGTGSALVDAQS